MVNVGVFLATYNGEPWIRDQIDSVLAQKMVNVVVYVSDDFSTDGSYKYFKQLSHQDNRVILLDKTEKFGSAGKNFYRLICDVETAGLDYLAFCDQDDIWHDKKLIHHVNLARQNQADGVSSNVTAFWPNEKKKLLNKAEPQKPFDYLFESAGPGCTFLMTPWLVNKVREQLNLDNGLARSVFAHDWLTYAVCRAYGRKWFIDSTSSLSYRQHDANEIGANVGLGAKWSRIKRLNQGWYRCEVRKIVQVCIRINSSDELKNLYNLLKVNNLVSNLKILCYVAHGRRSFVDRCLLALAIIAGIF